MASTSQQRLLYLFVCRTKPCTFAPTTDPREARRHYLETKHPYNAFLLPENVHLEGRCSSDTANVTPIRPAPLTLPASAPAETLEQKLQLLQGLLEKVEGLCDELVFEAERDPRIGEDSEVPDWLEEVSLDAANNKLEVTLFLQDLDEQPAATPSIGEVAHE